MSYKASGKEWGKYKLSELVDLITRGITPAYTEDKKVGTIVLNQKCIRENKINFELSRLTNPSKKKITEGKKLEKGDILVNSTGVGTLGRVARFNGNNKPVTVDSHITIVRPNNLVDSKFLGYNLFMNQRYIEHLGEGSTGQTELSRVRLGEAVKIMLPDLEEQKAIAKILSDLDEKIEINNKINKNLEEMAQAIFKRWFVDFEFPNQEGKPYKTSGGEMVESEIGLIPKGWKTGYFRDYIDNILGGDWGKEKEQGNYIEEVYCLRGADIPEVRVGKKGSLPKRYILEKNYKNKKLGHGDLVVEISGGSPTQSTGRITYITDSMLNKYDVGCVCTNFCRAITLKNKKAMEFIYFNWSRLYDLSVFFQFENGTTGIKNFDINTFLDRFEIVKPSEQIVGKFNETIKIFIKKIQANGFENESLEKLRNTLLPKLMSGEIRVPLDNIEN